jgi:short-subunit dehydrogenase
MRSYHNKVVWITGASSGIGASLAKAFASLGATCVLSSRNEKQLDWVRNQLVHPGRHLVLPLDLTASDTFPDAVGNVLSAFGRIDILVNNGGVSQRSLAAETSLAVDHQLMEVNFFGPVALTKAVLPSLRKSEGQIIVISSIAGKFGFFLRSTYAAAKHALHGFFESLALEEEGKVRVTIACPGKINTPISMSALNEKGERHNAMDDNQSTGMDVDVCAHKIIRAARKNRREVLIGKKEIIPVYLKRYCPALFWRIIRKQKAV